MKQLSLVVVLAACLSACGSSDVAPTPQPAQIAGNWTGTLTYFTSQGGPFILAIVENLTQAGSTVNGSYGTPSFDGTISGATTPSSFSGTFTYHSIATNGTTCTGTFVASGSAQLPTMTWTSPGVTSNCTNTPLNVTIAVQTR